jgi:SAM-dependent methyltransferase
MYIDGEYLKNNPTWDAEDSPWKAWQIFRLLAKNRLEPQTVCEVGCGSGEILRQLQMLMPSSVMYTGYEISPQAIELCTLRENQNLRFKLKNFTEEVNVSCDLLLIIDVIEHLEDYFQFLRDIKGKSRHVIFHIPLEIFVLSILYPHFLLGQKKKVGHLHFFSKDLILQHIRDLGYDVVDCRYTAGYSLPRDYGVKDRLLRFPRKILFPFAPDMTARVFGGYGLLVLVK